MRLKALCALALLGSALPVSAQQTAPAANQASQNTLLPKLEDELVTVKVVRARWAQRKEVSTMFRTPDKCLALWLDATLGATDLVIASPLYWYSVSSHVKRYLDHWSGWLRTPGVDFRNRMAGRTLWGVTALAHAEEEVAAPLVATLNHSAAYLGMRFGGVLLGNGSKAGDVLHDPVALARARTFFDREAPFARFPYEIPAAAGAA